MRILHAKATFIRIRRRLRDRKHSIARDHYLSRPYLRGPRWLHFSASQTSFDAGGVMKT